MISPERHRRPLTALRDHPARRRLARRKSTATVLVVLSQRDAESAGVTQAELLQCARGKAQA